MEKYSFKKNNNSYLDKLLVLLQEGLKYNLNLKDVISKVESVKNMLTDEIIRIVLLGSFSDGKTSAIAGLLGRLDNTMKIDPDESSDELKIYRPDGLRKGFEIVDTPGLFGTKEKEVNGENVKYSDITKKYLSEAHIIIYVCDAVVPLKDSHVPVIRWIMRDLGKLSCSIFVINKMDEAFDLTDDEDFNRGKSIKKQFLLDKLRETINLTPQEEQKVNVVCIAADPKGKGLAHWFNKSEEYLKRSHIGDLRKCLDMVVNQSNANELKANAEISAIRDAFTKIEDNLVTTIKPLEKTLPKISESCNDLKDECVHLRSELVMNKSSMQNQLNDYKAALYADINGASAETINEVIERALGRSGDKVAGYIVENNIKTIINACSNDNGNALKMTAVKFERVFSHQEQFLMNAASQGAGLLKNVQFANTDILNARNFFNLPIKFAPHGAKKLAANLSTTFKIGGAFLAGALEVYSWKKKYDDAKKLDKAKKEIQASLDDVFKNIYNSFGDDETYLKNYAPVYNEIQKQLKEREQEVENLKQKINELKDYKQKINEFIKKEAVDVDYEEIN